MASLYSMSQRSECSSRFFLLTRAISWRRSRISGRAAACKVRSTVQRGQGDEVVRVCEEGQRMAAREEKGKL